MGNCLKCCSLCNKQRKNITLIVTGLDNAGKTTIVKRLVGEPIDKIVKTVGFSLTSINYRGFKITIYDLGGSSNIRDIWNDYYMDAHGVMYVIDSSDPNCIMDSKRIFANVLGDKNISGKPVLLLANKQDNENALDELEVVEILDVEHVVNKYRCLTRVEVCSALNFESNRKIDPGIQNGFRWLIDNIIQCYDVLNQRVEKDLADRAELIIKDRERWRAQKDSEEENENQTPLPSSPIHFSNGKFNKSTTTLINTEISTMSSNSVASFNGTKQLNGKNSHKLSQIYEKHKKKFSRFNKIAPIPMVALLKDTSNFELNEFSQARPSKSGVVSGEKYLNRTEHQNVNYLTRRPATAPSRMNFK